MANLTLEEHATNEPMGLSVATGATLVTDAACLRMAGLITRSTKKT